ncbi:dsDNA nuclease domain-containing protein [Macrococcoides caseolyticum]|uniref:dsDNA nuclease domain-containing protein n=1 Tax=Macrococcoides caseolyticum TaxID=69966 RepID=UPI000C33D682|nr:dsDNA nuclease domain-containing protein [Macrococcus caseolyticus]PKE48584.1 hypothetical protein CW677_02900 [Macrococcus caseolyticus]PKF15635.1 hypothetical protein CW690_02900 [Macrococcus caseolyticus]TDM25995.1 DUF4297 domain-containing protein [Macrococcus caseolyticus]
MNGINNGGAIAIKGFNYQKISIMYVIIHHYKKNDFKIIPESGDDFEIHIDNQKYYIQVKGTKKVSLNKLISKPKGVESIIEKNLNAGSDKDNRKIFIHNLSDNTKKCLVKIKGTLFKEKYEFSDSEKEKIVEQLKLNSIQKNRLNKQFIYVTPFSDNLEESLIFLKGFMVQEGIFVDKERANLILNELAIEIDQKSEVIVKSEEDFIFKEINGGYLREVFLTVKQKDMFERILDNLTLNTRVKEKIKKEKIRIPLLYVSDKEKILSEIDVNYLLCCSTDEEAINYILSKIDQNLPKELSYSLAIDCFCEIEEGN